MSFFSNIANKAQNALNQTPLAQHMPSSITGHPQPSPNDDQSGSGGLLKSHAFESISHQFRTLQQQYTPTNPVQKIITAQKGIALNLDSVSRSSHAFSKELYIWGQSETEDLRDVTDRLGWLNYVQGSLISNLATKIDASRASFKALRDAENSLSGRRSIRANFESQIGRIEHEQQRGMEQKLAELKKQLQKAEADDEPLEREVELLKRKAVRDNELAKWDALREYGEKLILLSQAASAIIPVLPPLPPTPNQPYTGANDTATVRAALQHALDNYKPGDITLQHPPTAADLSRSDTRSFGVTHAKELSRINTAEPSQPSGVPVTPPATHSILPPAPSYNTNVATTPNTSSSPPPTKSPQLQPPPLNPAALNQTPAPIPTPNTPAPLVAPDPADPALKVPSVTPTVAETGMPQSAGPGGPGPASGSLRDLRQSSPMNSRVDGPDGKLPYGQGVPAYKESAEEEKRRLEREERERVLAAGGGQAPLKSPYESAEEEKKRLEREERERVLAAGGSGTGSGGPSQPPHGEGDADLPPYQEF